MFSFRFKHGLSFRFKHGLSLMFGFRLKFRVRYSIQILQFGVQRVRIQKVRVGVSVGLRGGG